MKCQTQESSASYWMYIYFCSNVQILSCMPGSALRGRSCTFYFCWCTQQVCTCSFVHVSNKIYETHIIYG